MTKEERIQQVLKEIASIEGNGFKYNEQAIFNEFKNEEREQSLPIKILSILGGFFATLFFLGFLLLLGIQNSGTGLTILGLFFIAGAIILNKTFNKLIIDTASISLYIIGYSVLAFGLHELKAEDNLIPILYIIISLITLAITQNYILSFISTLIISGSILTLITMNKGYDIIHLFISSIAILMTFCFLNEAAIIKSLGKLSKLYNPVRTGLVFSFIMGLVFVGKRGLYPLNDFYIWASSVVTIGGVIYVVSLIIKILEIKNYQRQMYVYASAILILLPTIYSPAISGSILILLLGFLVNHRSVLAIGILAFLYFISQYYYDLNFTLLEKSMILLSSGILFILIYLFTSKMLKKDEKV